MNEDKRHHIIELEEKYSENNYNGIDNGKCNFKIIQGEVPILLSAPHAVKQYRDGKIKAEDRFTGAIVEYLCEKTGVNGIIRVYNDSDDPNYENNGSSLKYKEAILDLIKEKDIVLLIDLHGCKDTHGFDIELGTNYGENINYDEKYLDILRNNFSTLGKIVVDNKFCAIRNTTVSNFINKKSNIQCVQMEISKRFRNDNLLKLLDVFEIIIKEIRNKNRNRDDYDEISR